MKQKFLLKMLALVVLALFSSHPIYASTINITGDGTYSRSDGLSITVSGFSSGQMDFYDSSGAGVIDTTDIATGIGGPPLAQRWAQTWNLDNTAGSGSIISFTFNFDHYSGISGVSPSGSASNYFLLYRTAGGSGNWSTVPGNSISGNTVIFNSFTMTTSNLEFTIGAGVGSPLPVKLTRFDIFRTLVDHELLAKWNTAHEVNCDKFVLVRRWSLNVVEVLATVPGNGNSMSPHEYTVLLSIDPELSGVLDLELWQYDYDGKITIYKKPYFLEPKTKFAVDPEIKIINPIKRSENLKIEVTKLINTTTSYPITVSLISPEGKTILSKDFSIPLISIDLESVIPGTYFVKVESRLEIFTIQRLLITE